MKLNTLALGLIVIVLADVMPRCSCGGNDGPYRPSLSFAITRITVDSTTMFPNAAERDGSERDSLRTAYHFHLFDAGRSVQVKAGMPLLVEVWNFSSDTMRASWRVARFRMPNGASVAVIPIDPAGGVGDADSPLPMALVVPPGVKSLVALAPQSYIDVGREEGILVPNHLREYETREEAARAALVERGNRYEASFVVESAGMSRVCSVELVVWGYYLPPDPDLE
jgi:hypothetical protein